MSSSFSIKYKLINKLGEGSFSEVFKCENRETRRTYAAKFLRKHYKNMLDVHQTAEITAIRKLKRHPNIVHLLEFHYDIAKGKVILILELMDVSLCEFLKARQRGVPEYKAKNYLYQILNGLHHLHTNDLFHRDIKPENILVKVLNPLKDQPLYSQNELIKLGDLGSIRQISSKPPYTEYISTRWYRSPECLLTIGEYGPKMDIWAVGCVFYEIFTLKPLFNGSSELDQLSKIHQVLGTPNSKILNKFKRRSQNYSFFPKHAGFGLSHVIKMISEEGLSILRMMLQYDPDLRANTTRLLNHKFFDTIRDNKLETKVKKCMGEFRSLSLNGPLERPEKKLVSRLKCNAARMQTSKTLSDVKGSKTLNHVSKIPLKKSNHLEKISQDTNKSNSIADSSKNHQKSFVAKEVKRFSKTTSYLPQYTKPVLESKNQSKVIGYQSKSFMFSERAQLEKGKTDKDFALFKGKPQKYSLKK